MSQPGPRTYYVLLAGQAVSFLGSQISGLAVGIAIFRQTGHATPLALVSVFWTAPQVVLAGFGGLLADRFDRRRLMLAANLGYALSSALLLLSFASGGFQLWHLYALMLANGVFAALEGPAFQSSITMLVPDSQRDRANALAQFAFPTAIALAAAAAGILYAAIGVTGAIEVDLLTFAGVIAVLALIRIPMPATTEAGAHSGGLLRQSLFGFGYLRARPGLLWLCLYIAVVQAVASGALVLMTPYVLDRVHSTETFGIVVGVGNSGAIAGALVMGAWGGTRPRMHTLMPSAVVIGLF
ncbi:MAG: MFS transporter, partial [Caulobacteraceae bacterium]